MPDVGLAADQDRPGVRVSGAGVLQRRAHLAGVQRVDPGVGLEHGEQHGRVLRSGPHPVVGGVAEQPAQLGRVGGGAVLVVPGAAERELLVAHHVQQRRRADHRPVGGRTLGERGPHQQAAVRAAHDPQPVRGGVARVDQGLGRGVQVVEHVLLVRPVAGQVPPLAFLAAAAQRHHRVAAAGGHPGQGERGVAGGEADPEAAVAVHQRRPRPVRSVRGDHEHAHRGAVGRGELALLGAHRWRGQGPGRGGFQHGAPGGQLEAVHLGRGDEVGPAQPHPAGLLRGVPVGHRQPVQRAVRGQRHAAPGRPVRRRVQRHLGHRVPGPGQHQQRLGRVRPGRFESAHRLQHRCRILGDQLAPVLPARGGRIGDGQSPARRAVGGVQVEPAVAVHPGVALHVVGLGEDRDQRAAAIQVGDPDAVPARGAHVAGDQQPAAVPGHAHPVVGVLVVQTRAVDQLVLFGGGADPVPPDPAVEGLLAGWGLVLVDHPDEEQLGTRLAGVGGQPGHIGVAAAVDRRLDVEAGVDVEHVQRGVLVAAVRELVGQPATGQVGYPGIQRGQALGIERGRVQQHPFGAVALPQVQHRVLLAGIAAGEEGPPGSPQWNRHRTGGQQRVQGVREPLPAGQGIQPFAGQRVLGLRPGHGARILRVLQPTVGVGDAVTVQVLDQIEAFGAGIAGSTHVS